MTVIIECPLGSEVKIEDVEGVPYVDRIITLPYPANYGYIPGTLAEDKDPYDVFVISKHKWPTGCRVKLENLDLVAKIEYLDQGQQDDKFIALHKTERFTIPELKHKIQTIVNFLRYYKDNVEIKSIQFQNLKWPQQQQK